VKQLLEHFENRRKTNAEAVIAPRRRVSVWMLAGTGVAVAALATALFTGVWRSAAPVEQTASSRPLTSYPGLELLPALSPDGGFVAFQWDGPEQKNWDIYVKDLGTGRPLRLTTNEAEDMSPAWSPDNSWVAFLRVEEERAIVMVVPPLGGSERIVGTIPIARAYNWDAGGRQLAWTPDGKWIAAPSPDENGNVRLFLLNVQSRETRELTPAAAQSSGVRDRNPAFSWDGRTLAFTRGSNVETGDLYLLRLGDDYRPAETPRPLTRGPGLNDSPAWRPDSREILFRSNRSGSDAIWSIAADGRTPAKRLSEVGENGQSPAVSRQDRLVYVNVRVQDTNLWKLPLNTPRATAVSFASSSRTDTSPQISPDGRAIVFQSDRDGPLEIWVTGSDGSGAMAVTRFGNGHTGTPRWSPDGQTIAFDSSVTGRFQVYTIPREGGEPRLDLLHGPGQRAGGSLESVARWDAGRPDHLERRERPVRGA
jgi:Tol biopolymer transport system component